MNRRRILGALGLAMAGGSLSVSPAFAARRPNIIHILADDLGYGDVHAFNPESKIPTPNLDRLAQAGMRFMDAHSGAAVCTPTRYGILTGRYGWRTPLKAGVANYHSNCLIEPGRMTAASLLRKHGYYTACVGKWHVGLEQAGTRVDYRRDIAFGPNQLGFDYAFYCEGTPGLKVNGDTVTEGGIDPAAATQEQLGGAWIENGTVLADGLRNWKQNEVGPTITDNAVAVIDRHAQQRPDQPLFLYLALSAVHNPVAPAAFCAGKSGIGAYGDFVCEVDWSVGEVLKALDRHGMTDDTLVIFTSDNGGVLRDLEKKGHRVNGMLRGGKADVFEGGHRVPFIVRWPNQTPADSVSEEVICLNDFLATCAALVGEELPAGAGEDSCNILPALLGKERTGPIREATVHHSLFGAFAIRQGPWKLILAPDSGGWSRPKPGTARGAPPVQLYNLEQDLGETTNVQDRHPEIVERLTALLKRYQSEGRSVRPP